MRTLTALLAGLAVAALPAASQDVPRSAPIFAEFSSNGGAADVREVRLVVDGRDVTSEATLTSLRVSYAPAEPLAPGEHSARVVVTDSLGRAWSKDWTFTVEPAAPVLEQVWSDDLLVEIERPPRQVRTPNVTVAGWTLPGAEVLVSVDGHEKERVVASHTGRFRTAVPLREGENALALTARRMDGGDESPEVGFRVERVPVKVSDDDEDVVTKPPQRRMPVPRVTPPRVVLADARRIDPATPIPQMPSSETPPRAGGPARREPASRPPAADPGLDPAMSDPVVPDPLPEPLPEGEVVITKPTSGQELRQDHATVLGRAPAGWSVTLLLDEQPAGHDVANPAGRFTIPSVEMEPGEHELVAEASSGSQVLRSQPVRVSVSAPRFELQPASLALTSPARSSVVARGGMQRVSGTAWDGAEIEVEVNGRIVAREIAGATGTFDVDVPLESGLNLVRVEASSMDGSRTARSEDLAVTATSRASTMPARTAARLEGPSRAPVGARPRPRLPAAPVGFGP